jgi:putative Ca2+/H+ antiporter (TMEM165/GDT1 family)
MDWKVFAATASAIFVAELADKTQLVGLSMAAKSGKPLTVLFGSLAGYLVVTALSVLIGALLSKSIKPDVVRYVGASLFILIGALMLFNKV